MKREQSKAERAAFCAMFDDLVEQRQALMRIECWVCGRKLEARLKDARAAGWKMGRWRTVTRGRQEQVDLCPDCEIPRGNLLRA